MSTCTSLSLEPRLSVLDFVSQLWRKIDFSPKLRDKIRNEKPGFKVTSFMPRSCAPLSKKQSSALSRLSWSYPQNVGMRYDNIHSYVCGHSPGWKPNIILLCSITAFEALLPLNFHQGWGSHAFHRYIRYSYVHPVTLSNA